MNFSIAQELDTETLKKSKLIQSVSDSLENFLLNKNYGESVKTYYIGFVGIKTKLGYENWYKERKPKYIEYRQTKNRITGENHGNHK